MQLIDACPTHSRTSPPALATTNLHLPDKVQYVPTDRGSIPELLKAASGLGHCHLFFAGYARVSLPEWSSRRRSKQRFLTRSCSCSCHPPSPHLHLISPHPQRASSAAIGSHRRLRPVGAPGQPYPDPRPLYSVPLYPSTPPVGIRRGHTRRLIRGPRCLRRLRQHLSSGPLSMHLQHSHMHPLTDLPVRHICTLALGDICCKSWQPLVHLSLTATS